jgi:membrane protein
MADNPAIQQPGARQPSSSSPVTTMWAVVLGWALVRLVVSGERSTPTQAGRPSSQPGKTRGQARNADSDFAEKQHASPQAAAEKGRG